ncbi:DUF2000 domain-containing protein [Candidatus Nomurabacteria bacterium]|nr:DUF2000 domain-containing protein [Candidatus Nomurabacteria bacterium]
MDDSKRVDQFVCVVNKKIDPAKLINAVAHMSAGLVNRNINAGDIDKMRFRDFFDMDKSPHPSISENGFIILRSDNSNKLRTLRKTLIEKGILFTDFTNVMVEGNHITQQREFDRIKEEELEYLGVCFFMNIDESRELTKKFSIYKPQID